MNRFIAIDEEGYLLSTGVRVTDVAYGLELLKNLEIENRMLVTNYQGQRVIVEAFDTPLVALNLTVQPGHIWKAQMPYGYEVEFDLEFLAVDEWDRFHGLTGKGIGIVLSRAAQMQLFNSVEEFDDESITVEGQKIKIASRSSIAKRGFDSPDEISSNQFWSSYYKSWKEENNPPSWDLGETTPTLKEIIPQIKIPKARICVLGCGSGHDAAYLASLGHIVTGVDLSREAIERARDDYNESDNLKFVAADAFTWTKENLGAFDVVYDRSFLIAIDPERRTEVIDSYRKLLAPGGHLLGVFYLFQIIRGPPFACSEWELRERLKKDFEFLYWTRWKTSLPKYLGAELVVYARKR